jgi:regulator of PEP synthase PpsR (kinase-PPPase family)
MLLTKQYMSNTYQIYLISDSTGETLDRIFLAIKAQFTNIKYKIHTYSFTRTENQILKILSNAKKTPNSIILYSIVDSSLAKYLANTSNEKNIPCFGVLGDLILSFSKLLNQKASHQPSGQHVLNEEYYKRIEAIQFTMNHDDGNLIKEIEKSDIVLLGVSRTSKTPTSIYLANKGFKTSNIPLVNENSIPRILKTKPKMTCVVGLNTEPERLVDIRKNRMNSLKENQNKSYTNFDSIKKEVDEAKNTFKKYSWPIIDVTRKSVEETAASIIKIYEIYKQK